MKKILFVFLFCLNFVSCTENFLTKECGGEQTITLDKGEKLLEITWKEDDIWLLTEKMDSNYTPKTKVFKEKSSLGFASGKVIIVERK